MKRTFLFVIPALLGLMACNKENPQAPAMRGAGDEVVFELGGEFVRGMFSTRASEVTTANISSLKVTATTGSSSESAVSSFANADFSKSGSDWKGGKYWPSTDLGYHFYAANVSMTHTASGQIVAPSNAGTDIVVGYIESPSYKTKNTLVMEHIFAQVGTVKMKAPEGYTVSNLKLSLQPVVGGTYNLKSKSWTSRGSAGSATYIVGSAAAGVNISTAGGEYESSDNDLWLVPGTYTLSCSYTIAKGAYSAGKTASASVSLEKGKNNNLGLPDTDGDGQFDDSNIPAPDDIAEVQFSVEVTPWEDNEIPVTFN